MYKFLFLIPNDPECFELTLTRILLLFSIPCPIPPKRECGVQFSFTICTAIPYGAAGLLFPSPFTFLSVTCTACFLLYIYSSVCSLAVCVSLEYTRNIYHHILKMDCVVGRGGDHLIVPFKFTFNRIGDCSDIIATGIPMWTGAVYVQVSIECDAV